MDREQAANELARRGVTLEDMKNYFLTVAEPVAAMGSGIVAEPLAGFAGLAAAPFRFQTRRLTLLIITAIS